MQHTAAASEIGRPDQREWDFRKWPEAILNILFAAAIALPLVGYLANGESFADADANGRTEENRPRNGLPKWDGGISSLLSLPRRFEKHFNDSFGYRKQLIDLGARTKVFGLGDSSNRWVVMGSDGWLFYAWNQELPAPHNPVPFQPAELHDWRRVLEARTTWLRQRGCEYLFVVAPEKQAVYPQYLPDWAREPASLQDRPAQLRDCLRGGVAADNFLDVCNVIRNAASRAPVYHQTDTHWNADGAVVAYAAIMRELSERIPGLAPLPPSRLLRTVDPTPGLDLAVLLGVSRHLDDEKVNLAVGDAQARMVSQDVEVTDRKQMGCFEPRVYENTDRTLPKAIVFGDSFSWLVLPWLAEHFSRLVYVPMHVLDPLVIEREKPDLVIQMYVGRKLFVIPPEDPIYHPGSAEVPPLAGGPEKQLR